MKTRPCTLNGMLLPAAAAIVLLSSGAKTAMAQDVHLGADFLTGFPLGTFSKNLGTNGYGASAFASYGIPRVPLEVGLEVGLMSYGSGQRREPLSLTIPEATVTVRTSNRILASHLFLRLHTPCGPVRPYVDALVGFKYLYTRTSVKGHWSSEPIAVSTNLNDWTLSYGVGGGVRVFLYTQRSENRKKHRPVRILLDARLAYVRGSTGDYLTPGAIQREDGRVVYRSSRSRTDMLMTHLGIAFGF